jgi:hypothetical protein
MNKTIKAIKRLRYDHPTSDLYGGEILPFDKLSIFQDMLLIFKIRNGLIKHNFVLTLLVDTTTTPEIEAGGILLPDGLIRFNNLSRETRDSTTLVEFQKRII